MNKYQIQVAIKNIINKTMSEYNSSSIRKSAHSQMKPKERKISLDMDTDMESTELVRLLVVQSKKELDEMIEHLDQKIKRRIEQNENKILYAYRNHLEKVNKELKLIKQKHEKYEKNLTSDSVIIHLAKQCSLFRQEAMRLHNQLEDALAEVDVYRRRSELLNREMILTDNKMKEMIGKLKRFQITEVKNSQEIKSKNMQIAELNKKLNMDPCSEQKIVENDKKGMGEQRVEKTEKKMTKYQTNDLRIQISTKKSPIYTQLSARNRGRSHTPKTAGNRQALNMTEMNIFTNQKIFDFKNKKPQTPTNNSINKTGRKKVNSSALNYSQCQLQNIYDYCETEQQERKEAMLGTNSKTREQLQAFDSLMLHVKNARHNCDAPENRYQSNIDSVTILDFISSDQDLIKFMSAIFPNLSITIESTKAGVKFRAKMKEGKKDLVYLSSQLMKKFKLKATSPKTARENILNGEETNSIGLLIYQNSSAQQKNQQQSQSMKKINETFKKKTFMKKQRQMTYHAASSKQSFFI